MKFPAKSSKESSYAPFLPLPAVFNWKAGTYQEDDWKKNIQDYCATKREKYLQAPMARWARFAHGIPGKKWGQNTIKSYEYPIFTCTWR
jgi:hypothetical protein